MSNIGEEDDFFSRLAKAEKKEKEYTRKARVSAVTGVVSDTVGTLLAATTSTRPQKQEILDQYNSRLNNLETSRDVEEGKLSIPPAVSAAYGLSTTGSVAQVYQAGLDRVNNAYAQGVQALQKQKEDADRKIDSQQEHGFISGLFSIGKDLASLVSLF